VWSASNVSGEDDASLGVGIVSVEELTLTTCQRHTIALLEKLGESGRGKSSGLLTVEVGHWISPEGIHSQSFAVLVVQSGGFSRRRAQDQGTEANAIPRGPPGDHAQHDLHAGRRQGR